MHQASCKPFSAVISAVGGNLKSKALYSQDLSGAGWARTHAPRIIGPMLRPTELPPLNGLSLSGYWQTKNKGPAVKKVEQLGLLRRLHLHALRSTHSSAWRQVIRRTQ